MVRESCLLARTEEHLKGRGAPNPCKKCIRKYRKYTFSHFLYRASEKRGQLARDAVWATLAIHSNVGWLCSYNLAELLLWAQHLIGYLDSAKKMLQPARQAHQRFHKKKLIRTRIQNNPDKERIALRSSGPCAIVIATRRRVPSIPTMRALTLPSAAALCSWLPLTLLLFMISSCRCGNMYENNEALQERGTFGYNPSFLQSPGIFLGLFLASGTCFFSNLRIFAVSDFVISCSTATACG